MNSRTLSFNRPVFRNAIRRCWPLWAVYLGYLIVTFTVNVLSFVQRSRWDTESFLYNAKELIYNNAVFQARASVVVGILAVMVLFGYMYNSRGNTLMNSLPVKRESLFLTVYLTGLIPMLACQVLVAGITLLLSLKSGISPACFLEWLACAALGLLAFYGFAVFCAQLTGNIIILPLVYAVLNLTAIVFETCVRNCLATLIYGMTTEKMQFYFLSPIANIADKLNVTRNYPVEVRLEGMGVLAAYAAAGLVFSVLAVLLYRKRRMEAVSDFVAIPILKPVFRYCMGFGAAFVFAAVMNSNFFRITVSGAKAAWMMAALLQIGAFLGWLIAEMMIRRSVRVLPLPWKGLVIVCAVCILTVVAAESDLTGFERRIPDLDKVEKVELSNDNTVFSDPANIHAAAELHRRIIENKALYDGNSDYMILYSGETAFATTEYDATGDAWGGLDPQQVFSYWLPIRYVMKDGRSLTRMYTLHFRAEDVDRPESVMGQVRALLNTAEGIQSRMKPDLPMEEQFINYAVIEKETADGGVEHSYRLTPEETVELWNTAMLPDAADGNLSLFTIADTEENLKTQTNLRIDINLFDQLRLHDPHYWYHSYRVFTFSERCLEWIEEHCDLEWENMADVYEARTDAALPLA
ncbi:MAG: hypothetical protein IJV40_04690 [Oscillospiraceae bacterium]|nr:hypothetical protein [Oscillospiraceae bacterium]